jgi:dipeptidyl aminopeptidase/acylaminoacyl peptidase
MALILRGACAALLLAAAGCAGNRVHVVTDPAGSQVNFVNAKGKTVATGFAPMDANVKFSRSNPNYMVEITPPLNLRDRYNQKTTNLTEFEFQKLPVFKGEKHRLMDTKLEEKLFVLVPYVEVVLDSQKTWRGAVIRSRAYKDVSEVGGAVPTQVAELSEDGGIQSLALSPDGNRIVYSEATYNLSPSELQKVYSAAEPRPIDILGANLKGISVLTHGVEAITSENFRDMFPSFTPDGQYLLFASNRRRSTSEDILRISALHRSGVSDIYVHRDARLMHPTQAKDGTIAYCVEEPNPQDPKKRFTLWTLGGPNQFPTQIQTGSQPSISPDGKRIAYIGADENLWVVNTDGSQATQLTFGADKILDRYKASLSPEERARYERFVNDFGFPEKKPFSYPSWSADGHTIVYAGMEGSDSTGRPNEDIWIMDFDGSNKRQLTTNGSIDRYPLLSPDGKWVYFMSNRGGHWAIWRIPTPEK